MSGPAVLCRALFKAQNGVLLAVFAKFQRENLRERVRAGLAHARQNGKQLGRPLTAGLQCDQEETTPLRPQRRLAHFSQVSPSHTQD
jgi:DNA invertase Pin-like site-specific DNA recombinase